MLELAVEFVLGISYILTGAWLFTGHMTIAPSFVALGQGNRPKVVQMALAGLLIAAFVVWAHPVYTWPGVIVTLVGYGGMIEAATYLLYKPALPRLTAWLAEGEAKRLRTVGVLAMVLGVVITGIWASRVF